VALRLIRTLRERGDAVCSLVRDLRTPRTAAM
jgi:hypothetical protein